MNIEDVKNIPRRERRTCRANLRLFPSQMKFIDDNELSIQRIFDKALNTLGHVTPKPEEIDKIAHRYKLNSSRRRGNRGGTGRRGSQKTRIKNRRE